MGREEQHILFSQIQHVPHLWPREDQGFQLTCRDGDFSCNPLPGLVR